MVDVLNEVGEDMRARVRTSEFMSKLHLVDLAGGCGQNGEQAGLSRPPVWDSVGSGRLQDQVDALPGLEAATDSERECVCTYNALGAMNAGLPSLCGRNTLVTLV